MAGSERPGYDTPALGHGQMRTKQFDRRILNQLQRLFFLKSQEDLNSDATALDNYTEVTPDSGLPVAIVDYGQPTGWKYQTPGGTATTVYSANVLHALVINTTAASTITLYDGPSAALGIKFATLKASIAEGTYVYDVQLTTGKLTVVLAGASDVTALLN